MTLDVCEDVVPAHSHSPLHPCMPTVREILSHSGSATLNPWILAPLIGDGIYTVGGICIFVHLLTGFLYFRCWCPLAIPVLEMVMMMMTYNDRFCWIFHYYEIKWLFSTIWYSHRAGTGTLKWFTLSILRMMCIFNMGCMVAHWADLQLQASRAGGSKVCRLGDLSMFLRFRSGFVAFSQLFDCLQACFFYWTSHWDTISLLLGCPGQDREYIRETFHTEVEAETKKQMQIQRCGTKNREIKAHGPSHNSIQRSGAEMDHGKWERVKVKALFCKLVDFKLLLLSYLCVCLWWPSPYTWFCSRMPLINEWLFYLTTHSILV